MRADGGKDVLVLFGQMDGPFQRPAVRIAGADSQYCANSGVARALDYLLAVSVVLRSINVRMGIDEHLRNGLAL
jgi:hypothetical protein